MDYLITFILGGVFFYGVFYLFTHPNERAVLYVAIANKVKQLFSKGSGGGS